MKLKMSHWIIGSLGFALAVIGLAAPVSAVASLPFPATCDGISQFFHADLKTYQDQVDLANQEYQAEDWLAETADPKASSSNQSKLFTAVQKAVYDPGVLKRTQAMDDATQSIDPKTCDDKRKLARARYLLETAILTDTAVIQKEKENQDLQQKLMDESNGFRVTLPGEKEPASRALYVKALAATADRDVRHQLYLKFNALRAEAWMNWGFRDLIHSRNEEGKLAGYPGYLEYRYFRNQLDLNGYRQLVSEVKTKLAPKLRAEMEKLAKSHGIAQIEPWDMAYLTEQASSGELDKWLAPLAADSALDFARFFYAGLGFSIDSLGFTMDLYPRPGKNTHAFTMGVVFPQVDDQGNLLSTPKPDIRFLANLKQPVHWADISTVIHELGHAVHASQVRQPVGVFRDFGSVGTEAIAMTMERMAASSEFLGDTLSHLSGASSAQLKPVLSHAAAAGKFQQAYMIVRQIFFSDFEIEMYTHPDADYREIWSRLYQEYYGVNVPLANADWDVEHFLMAPIYVQNYSIGLLMVEQLYASMLKDFGTSYRSTALGDKLSKIYFGQGTEFNYLELVKRFTGKPLSSEDALKILD